MESAGIPKPGGTVKPGTAAPAVGGGGGELAAKTLPIWHRGGTQPPSHTRPFLPFTQFTVILKSGWDHQRN